MLMFFIVKILRVHVMSYIEPSEFVTKMVDAGESKIFMSTKDTLVRAFMAGAILALAAFFCCFGIYFNQYPTHRSTIVSCWLYYAVSDEV